MMKVDCKNKKTSNFSNHAVKSFKISNLDSLRVKNVLKKDFKSLWLTHFLFINEFLDIIRNESNLNEVKVKVGIGVTCSVKISV